MTKSELQPKWAPRDPQLVSAVSPIRQCGIPTDTPIDVCTKYLFSATIIDVNCYSINVYCFSLNRNRNFRNCPLLKIRIFDIGENVFFAFLWSFVSLRQFESLLGALTWPPTGRGAAIVEKSRLSTHLRPSTLQISRH